ncbi:hypothetical protein [Streptomyces sp. 5-10]|uniref:hypothetical protein n=1 Tax=Streptomyces sp. 5-10 TaxID=878925 RepID=UPI00168B1C9B|nr:hypothetical protein [Streptomyces sp. 5-10]MBD3010304.1 hypothetical protein [Streptomyces sp. 5-10]
MYRSERRDAINFENDVRAEWRSPIIGALMHVLAPSDENACVSILDVAHAVWRYLGTHERGNSPKQSEIRCALRAAGVRVARPNVSAPTMVYGVNIVESSR